MHSRLNRPFFLFAVLLALAACDSTPTARTPRILDTHIHLYDTARPQGVPWPGKSDTVLYKPHLPADYEAVARANGVTAAVIVEASEWTEDNQWLLDLVKNDPRYIGIVGNLRPGADDFAKHLDRFAKDDRFVGIRPRIDPPLKLTDDRVIADLKRLADKGLALDMLVHGGAGDEGTLAQLAVVAQRVPNLTIVINHLAGVKVDGNAPDPKWVERVKACAKHRNVYCKISGLDQQAGRTPAVTDLAFYKPVLDALWDAFGEDRVIYGSNWPVTNVRITYGEHLKLIRDYVAGKGEAAANKLFWKNAVRAYRLKGA